MFVLLAMVKSSGKNKYPAGERHAVIALVKNAVDYKEVETIAMRELGRLGWENLEPEKIGTLDSEVDIEEFKEPIEFAQKNGFAAVIYNKPENKSWRDVPNDTIEG